jgi:hypothetical protein
VSGTTTANPECVKSCDFIPLRSWQRVFQTIPRPRMFVTHAPCNDKEETLSKRLNNGNSSTTFCRRALMMPPAFWIPDVVGARCKNSWYKNKMMPGPHPIFHCVWRITDFRHKSAIRHTRVIAAFNGGFPTVAMRACYNQRARFPLVQADLFTPVPMRGKLRVARSLLETLESHRQKIRLTGTSETSGAPEPGEVRSI